MEIETKELTPELWLAVEQLFLSSKGCDGCWCYNHHIVPGTPDVRGEPAKEALKELILHKRTYGILAFIQEKPVGWCALDRKAEIPGHDCVLTIKAPIPHLVWSIHCFYVSPDHRGQGVADHLMRKAIDVLKSYGATEIEGYPIPPNGSKKKPAEDSFSGPFALYEKYGFERKEDIDDFYTRMVKVL